MSDFVSSLISRSFAGQPALRPRAASLFEPTVAADFAHAEAPRPRSAETASEVDVEQEAIPNAGRQATFRNQRVPQIEQSRDANPAASFSSQVTPARRALAGAEERMQEPVVPTVRPHKTPTRVNPGRVHDPTIEDAALIEPASRSLSARMPAPPHPRELAVQTEPLPQVLIATQAVPEIAVAQQRAASQPDEHIQTRRQRRGADPSPLVKATAESTINVTIGTVEVRATMESKPAPGRAPSASPVMSLHDYLQRRQAGGSR